MTDTPRTDLRFDETRRLMAEGARWLPGGASSDYRLGSSALVLDRAEGALLFDVDGNRLIDYYCGAGPIILGHDAPVVVDAVMRQLSRGVQLGGETVDEYTAARLVTEIVPCAEMVRFANTGSEAVQLALRIGRAATGRDVVVKFEGHYHGWLDSVFVGLPGRPDVAPGGDQRLRTSSAGQDPASIEHTEVLPWNDLDAVDARLARGDVGVVITEPLWRGYIRPQPGYLEGLQEICRRHGSVLVFDEIVSGFRAGPGGGQGLFGVIPDVATYAKAMANGFVISAVAGRRDLLDQLGGGPVVHPGTYNGNALSMAAAVATLGALQEGAPYEAIERAGGRLMAGFSDLLAAGGVKSVVQGVPGSFNVHLGIDRPVTSLADTAAVDTDLGEALTMALLRRGVRIIPGGHWYVSGAHTDALVDETLDAFESALRSIRILARPAADYRRSRMSEPSPSPRPRVFPMRRGDARMNNPTSRSVRLVTPESTGQGRLYAGSFWSEPGSEGAWAFVPDDPDQDTMAGGYPHLGDHDEVYLCLAGRIRADWEGFGETGSFEFEAGDVVHWPAGYTIRNKVLGDEPAHVFWVMGPAPDWMMPLTDPGSGDPE